MTGGRHGAPEVTVVGAGPVGMTLAALLGARGRRVVVLERRPSTVAEPRAVHIDHQATRILDAAGVMGAMAGRTEAMDAYEWRNAAGEVLLRIQPDGPLGRSGWPESSMFAQPDLEAALAARLEALATVTVRRGVEVRHLDDLGEGWVVGCDGAASTVRQLAGIATDDLGSSHEWLIVDVVEHPPRPWVPCNVQLCDPARPTTAVSGGPGRRRFEYLRLPGEDAGELASEATAWHLLEPWGVTPASATIERRALYRSGARVVREWGKGRVLLAGDAAHQMPPFAGQGLCAGLRDAANLGWKLDSVLAGTAPAGLLATYGTERAPQTATEVQYSVDLGRIICTTDAEEAAARDAAMVAGAAQSGPIPPPPLPPLGPGLLLGGDAAAGSLGVHGGDLDGRVGRGWVLHGRHGDPSRDLDAGAAAWYLALGGTSVDCSTLGGPYPRWFAELDAEVVLVRPDFAVYGTGAGAPQLISALRRQLHGLGQLRGAGHLHDR